MLASQESRLPADPVQEGKFRVLWILVSSLVGALGGLILAEVICYSLIEISMVPAFAIVRCLFTASLLPISPTQVFGVGFVLLGLALGWRIWISVPGWPKKVAFLAFAVIVRPACARWAPKRPGGRYSAAGSR